MVMFAWISNSIPRPPSKRAVAIAFTNCFSQLGNVAGSYVYIFYLPSRFHLLTIKQIRLADDFWPVLQELLCDLHLMPRLSNYHVLGIQAAPQDTQRGT